MRVNGWIMFAGMMMILAGTMGSIAGLIAIIDDEVIVATGEGTLVAWDATTWGWFHLIIGIIVVLAGFALFSGALWARIIAIILATLSALSQIAWIDHYPFWSIAIIGIDIAIIWSCCTMGRSDEVVDFEDLTATPDTDLPTTSGTSGGPPPAA